MDNQLAQQAQQQRQISPADRIKSLILSTEVKARFAEMMGDGGIYYLNQVMILVANSDDLQKCTPKSILVAAMRAASLRLSVDPGQGQAWIIPYNGIATFQLGYKGVYELALRTNLYKYINVIDVYEGEEVSENRMTGIHVIAGKRTSSKAIGRMLYFELTAGYSKTFYMTCEEIEAHARHYSKAYSSPKSKWNDPYERAKMERKTVLVNGLRRWGRFNEDDSRIIEQIESGNDAPLDRFHVLPEDDDPAPQLSASTESSPKTEVQQEKEWTSSVISLEMAKQEKDEVGQLLWDYDIETLRNRENTLDFAIKSKGGKLSAGQLESKQLRLAILREIIKYREEGENTQ